MTGEPKVKTAEEVAAMREGGLKLREIKKRLMAEVRAGVSAADIDALATKLIRESGGEPSFMMVPGYKWATCINVNAGVVHGIPKKSLSFKKGDLVSIDVGMYYKGFHTDTSTSLMVGVPTTEFLEAGQKALKWAIREARAGKRIMDISAAIEKTLRENNLNPVRALVGHGVGRELHEAPAIPGFVSRHEPEIKIKEGFVLAIEVMYSEGTGEIVTGPDGWTIETADGKIAGLFEETVAVTADGPFVLT